MTEAYPRGSFARIPGTSVGLIFSFSQMFFAMIFSVHSSSIPVINYFKKCYLNTCYSFHIDRFLLQID